MTQSHESTTRMLDAAEAPLPPAPRPVTPLVRRRAWGDIHVRFWWLSALGVLAVMSYFTVWRISDALRDRAIIQQGHIVETTMTSVDSSTTPGYAVLRHQRVPVRLSGKLPDGRTMEFEGTLSVAAGYARVGQPLTIRVDREDPTRWTDRTEVVPWAQELALTLMFLPVIVALLVIAWIMRGKIVRLWRDGAAADGEIVELRTYAIAPLSRGVKYRLIDSPQRRLFSALWPNRAGPLAVGQRVRLLVGRNGRSLLAHLYAGGDTREPAVPPPRQPVPATTTSPSQGES